MSELSGLFRVGGKKRGPGGKDFGVDQVPSAWHVDVPVTLTPALFLHDGHLNLICVIFVLYFLRKLRGMTCGILGNILFVRIDSRASPPCLVAFC